MKIQKEYLRDGKAVPVSAEWLADDRWRVRIGAATYEYHAVALGDGGVRLAPVGQEFERSFVAYGVAMGGDAMVRVNGRTHTLQSPSARRGAAGGGADGNVRAPMTGTVMDVLCAVGDEVAADQTLAVLSAMKMEHKLTAGVAGIVQVVSTKPGATVEQGATLVVVEPKPADANATS
jgi:biotin carboxyl carrier protein